MNILINLRGEVTGQYEFTDGLTDEIDLTTFGITIEETGVPIHTSRPDIDIVVTTLVDSGDTSGACQACLLSFNINLFTFYTGFECLVSCQVQPEVTVLGYEPLSFDLAMVGSVSFFTTLSSSQLPEINNRVLETEVNFNIGGQYSEDALIAEITQVQYDALIASGVIVLSPPVSNSTDTNSTEPLL